MNRDEILAKSRAEHKDQDIYEQEVLRQAAKTATIVQMLFALIFLIAQLVATKTLNWGLWAVVFSANMTVSWFKYLKMHRNSDFAIAIAYTVLVLAASGYYLHHLFAPAGLL